MSQIQAPKVAPSIERTHPTILLFGPTGSGKTAQLGELAEYYYKKTKQLPSTRLYTADLGGTETIRPHIELGLIEVVSLFGDPWVWINHAIKGDKLVNGKWVPGTDPNISLYAFEGMTSFADAVMGWMREAAAKGISIGGGAAVSFTIGTGQEMAKIGNNNQTHYGVAQQQVYEKSTQSQYLPGTVLWTAGDSRGEDDVAGGVVGPQIAGKALTGEAPRWFKYTFRINVEPAPTGAPKHVLYTDMHMEMSAKGAKGIANARVPLAGQGVDVPLKIEPASLVNVLELLDNRQHAAKDDLRKRLGL